MGGMEHMISALRLASSIIWFLIVLWGAPSFWRVACGISERRDWIPGSFALLGMGMMIFNVRALSGAVPIEDDYWTALGIASTSLSGLGFLIFRSYRAPAGHRRAALMSHGVILALCLAAGALV